jgi:hypothetical protein
MERDAKLPVTRMPLVLGAALAALGGVVAVLLVVSGR